jgi:hypothetical protein
LARPNFQYEKRQRDLAKKKKQEEKRQRKLDKANTQPNDNIEQSPSVADTHDMGKSEQTITTYAKMKRKHI